MHLPSLPRVSFHFQLPCFIASLAVTATGAVPLIGNLTITQNDTGNSETSVSGVITQGNGATYVAGSRGDFGLRFHAATPAADVAEGILMTSIRENGRSNEGTTPDVIGAGLAYSTPAIQTQGNLGAGNTTYPGYSTSINVSNTAVTGVASGEEWNANQSFAYFKYTDWLGGWVTNGTHKASGGTNNGAMNAFVSSSQGFTVASGASDPGTSTVFDSTANAGFYTLRLANFSASRGSNPPVAATSDNGILLVTGGKNEDNYALSSANADGTFTLICKDNGTDAFNFENDPVAFVYIPTGHSDVAAMGRVDAEGDVVAGSGNYTVTKGGTGKWFVSAPGLNDGNSVLIISPEGATVSGTNRGDNIWSFQWDPANSHWVVESRDVSATATANPTLQNLTANEPAFSFALFTDLEINPPPVVSLDSPTDGSIITAGSPLTLAATATDNSAVTKVEFFNGTELLGEDLSPPYELAIPALPIGTHALTVRATDDDGATTSSTTVKITIAPAPGTDGLYFDGVDDHVTFGDNPALKLSTFTVECWFKREAGGTTAGTGVGGITAIPLITKGRGENDNSGFNCNYFVGIEASSGKLAADFEDLEAGLNHPAVGTTVIPTGVWQHMAVTFDGTAWTLYLNGKEEVTVSTEGQVPEHISIQHAGLGTAMNSTGVREGYFHGQMDEVRIWNTPRGLNEIQATMNSQITGSAPGLVARYGMNEKSGTALLSSAGTAVTGTLVNGVHRTGGAPFNLDVPPVITLASPADNSTEMPLTADLSAVVDDLNGGPLKVTFHGRSIGDAGSADDFAVIALPDTQYYSENVGGNRAAIFSAQTDWIVAEKDVRNIGFVLHLGDITEHGDNPAYSANEWANASNAMYRLENPVTTMDPEGVPYIVAVGNHDQTPIGNADGSTTNFNTFFGVHPETGVNHFAGKSYYGGTSEPTKADNNYTLFTAGGLDFIVISFEYDTTPDKVDLDWADALLKAHPSRRGIVITHHTVNTGNPASFSAQGSAIYQALKNNPNLILMHGGHIHGEGRRSDTFEGRTVHSILADYQSRSNGGNGWLRIMNFRPSLNRIDVLTYSPTLNQYESDADSQFSLDVNLSGGVGPFTEIGTVEVEPGTASIQWPGLLQGGRYEWYAEVTDGTSTVTTPVRTFITEGAQYPPVVAMTGPANGTHFADPASITLEASASDTDGNIAKVAFFSGTTLLGEVTAPPYVFQWNNVPAGSYTVIAKATDNDGLVTTAAPISVQVLAEPATPDVQSVSSGLFNPNWVVAATSPAPRQFNNPGSDNGDLAIHINGSPVPFASGITATTNWENAGNTGGVTSKDNITAAYADASGNLFVSTLDNANNNSSSDNPATTEESAGTAVAFLPYSAGFTGASVSADGSIISSNLPTGASVSKLGGGLYSVSGLSLAGNLLAFTNGDSGTDADNVLSVKISNGGWIVDVRDNGAGNQDGAFSFVYLPAATPALFSGRVTAVGALMPLNGALSDLGATVSATANHIDITLGDGTAFNPSNTVLLLTADSTDSALATDNLMSYEAVGNSFRIYSQDLPNLDGNNQATDFRFAAVPLDPRIEQLPVVTIEATDAVAGEHGADQSLAFTVTRTGPTSAPLQVSYSTAGATSGADFIALSGSVEIPAGSATAVIPVTVLPDELAEGPETLEIKLTASSAYSLNTETSAMGTIADRPLQAYLFANGLGSAEGDEDGDGIKNILEYYMGTDADDSSSSSGVTAIAVGNGTFTARFARAKAATDVTVTVEWSTDLQSWHASGESNGSQTATVALQPVSPPEQDPETVEAVLSITTGPVPTSVYLRLAVKP